MGPHRGGIRACLRPGCRKVRLFGLTGMFRRIEFEHELYEEYQKYTTGGDDDV